VNASHNLAKPAPLLFVYGTLMKGFREDWQRKVGAEFVGSGTIRANLYDLGDYPGAKVVGAEPGHRMSGELYRLRDPELAVRRSTGTKNSPRSGPTRVYSLGNLLQ